MLVETNAIATELTAPGARTLAPHGFRVAIFSDGADVPSMLEAHRNGTVDGFTTNPTLMAKAGVPNYRNFAQEVLTAIPDLPISFEVFADEFSEMAWQAREIASWGRNVYIKIPITNTRGESAVPLIRELAGVGLKINVTAVMTLEQVEEIVDAVTPEIPAICSIFAGRIADTGVDPVPVMRQAAALCREQPNLEVLWASPREVLNIYQAEECGCDIIAVTPDLLKKISLRGKDLHEFSRETVQMFFEDAQKAQYTL